MKRIVNYFISIFNKIKDFIPTSVPQGRTDLENLVDTLIATYSPPMSRVDVKWVVCTLLQRLEPFQGNFARRKFSLALKRAAAGQVGVTLMQELKDQQKADFDATQAAAKQAEVTATPSTNDTSVQNDQVPIPTP